ncbi:MAG: GerW family sporulation protein [Terriglobia bacterium]
MSIQDFFRSFSEGLQSSAQVKTVYGEPIVSDGRTVVPVAKVAYGFGGGLGARTKGQGENKEAKGTDEGGGGGVAAIPVGVVEITKENTRFISFRLTRKLVGAVTAGLLLGYVCGRLRARR